MPFFSERSKLRSMFEIMGCAPSASRSDAHTNVCTPMGVQCQQITVVPLLQKRHSKSSERMRRIRPHADKRQMELLAAYNKNYTSPEMITEKRKVFLSQPQSADMKFMGERRPCAPPVTPTPELMRKVQYIPSLHDVQAQRSLRGRLQDMEKSKKEQKARQKEAQLKKEAEKKKEDMNKLRVYQRSQIYALNAAMTELEHQRFNMFLQQIGNKS